MKFKDFLTEEELFEAAPGRMTKSKWRDALVLVPRGERHDFSKFAASVEKIYGIGISDPKDYAKVAAAFESLGGKVTTPARGASPAQAPAAKPAPVKAKPKNIPGLKISGDHGDIIGSGELFKAIDKALPLVRDNGTLYKAVQFYFDNLWKYRESQGAKPSARETQHIGEVKTLLAKLNHHLVELSRQTELSYNV